MSAFRFRLRLFAYPLCIVALLSCKSTQSSLASHISDVTVHDTDGAPVAAAADVENPLELHTNISNQRRIQLLKNVSVGDVMSAPGHSQLRSPEKIVGLAQHITATGGAGFDKEPIVIGVFTRNAPNGSGVIVRSVEVQDGNHRLAAGLLSGKWQTIGNIPANFLKVMVNGWAAGGSQSEPRWIPLAVAQKSSIPRERWFQVPDNWGPKDPTAQIPGDIASIDKVFPAELRGVPLKNVLVISLQRINADIPDWLQ